VKATAYMGSPRKNGNTEILCNHALKAIAEEGIETELVRLAEYNIKPCTGCDGCVKTDKCVLEDDLFPLFSI
jgi:multimeric flavodoxin WrbA